MRDRFTQRLGDYLQRQKFMPHRRNSARVSAVSPSSRRRRKRKQLPRRRLNRAVEATWSIVAAKRRRSARRRAMRRRRKQARHQESSRGCQGQEKHYKDHRRKESLQAS